MSAEFTFKVVVMGNKNDIKRTLQSEWNENNNATLGVDFSQSTFESENVAFAQINIWHPVPSQITHGFDPRHINGATSCIYFDDKEKTIESHEKSFSQFAEKAAKFKLPAIRVSQAKKGENNLEVVNVSYKLPDGSEEEIYTVPKEEVPHCVKKLAYCAANTATVFARSLKEPTISILPKEGKLTLVKHALANFVSKLKSGFDAILNAASCSTNATHHANKKTPGFFNQADIVQGIVLETRSMSDEKNKLSI